MKHIKMVMAGNFRKNKGVYISIFILMLIVSMSLCSVLTYYVNANKRDEQVMKENGFGDMLAELYSDNQLKALGVKKEDIIKKIEACNAVEKIKSSPAVISKLQKCNEKEADSNHIIVINEKDKNIKYTQYDSNKQKISKGLKKGEVSIPTSYMGMYDCKIGDFIEIGSKEKKYSYKVASYFEDTYMGTSIMGLKTVIISSEDMKTLFNTAKKYDDNKEAEFLSTTLLSVFKNKNKDISSVEFEKELNKTSNFASYTYFSLPKEDAIGYMMLLTNIFSAVLVVFALMLLVAVLIVLGHNISSNIELDYEDIGILKAVGMTNGSLKIAIILGYMSAVILGLLAGIPISYFVVGLINDITLSSSGIYISNVPEPALIFAVVFSLSIITILFIMFKTIKLSYITPLKAINSGSENVHFSSMFKLPISKKFLNISIAYRQFISEKKQYIAAIIVTAILTVFMIIINDTCKWAKSDNALSDMFSILNYDIEAKYDNKEIEEKAENIVNKYSGYTKYRVSNKYMLFDNVVLYCYITEKPEKIMTVKEGRTCQYDNEILITQYISDEFHLKVGDEVEIKKESISSKYIISGIYESAMDVGRNFAMSYDGYKKFLDKESLDENWGSVCYELKDKGKIDQIIKNVKNEIKDKNTYEINNANEDTSSGMGIISDAVSALTILVYILGAVFVMLTVSIVCGRIVKSEKRDYGIYKAMGFTSFKIRIQLAVRFIVTAAIGSVIGSIFAIFLSGPFYKIVFSSFGIFSFKASLGIMSFVVPMLFMCVIFSLSVFIKSRKVKGVEPRVLIIE